MKKPSLSITLASSSKYKKEVLSKLGIPFRCFSPEIDESPIPFESPADLVTRLATEKAVRVFTDNKIKEDQLAGHHYVIGVDQIALFNNKILGKPHTVARAIAQLTEFSGKTVTFLTAVCLMRSAKDYQVSMEPYEVTFKPLTEHQIIQYVQSELPLDCAGSFKCEGQGILLFSEMRGRDQNALIGLPLLALQEQFLEMGVDLFDYITPKISGFTETN